MNHFSMCLVQDSQCCPEKCLKLQILETRFLTMGIFRDIGLKGLAVFTWHTVCCCQDGTERGKKGVSRILCWKFLFKQMKFYGLKICFAVWMKLPQAYRSFSYSYVFIPLVPNINTVAQCKYISIVLPGLLVRCVIQSQIQPQLEPKSRENLELWNYSFLQQSKEAF